MKMGICYCQMGIMSQCVAADYGDQYACDFFDKSGCADRCMHRNESMNNHCWNPEAQAFSREHGVIRVEDVELDEEFNINDDFIDEMPGPRRNCQNCILHPCHEIVQQANAALDRGGLAQQEFWDIGSACPEYSDEEMMNAAIKASLTP